MRRLAVLLSAGLVAVEALAADFTGYAHKAYITFGGYEGVTTLTNFPALVKLAQGAGGFSYADCLGGNGQDVRFSLGDGAELPSECVKWDASGTSEFWVLIPELKGVTTRIMMYWGNASAPKRGDASDIWCNNYAGVWHLDDAACAVADSSPYRNHGGAGFSSAQEAGVVGKCRSFDASKTQIAGCGVGNKAEFKTNAFTHEVWFRFSAYPSADAPFFGYGFHQSGAWANGAAIGINASGSVRAWVAAKNGTFTPGSGPVSLDAWHHLALCVNKSASGTAKTKVYLDGTLLASEAWDPNWYTGSYSGAFNIGGWQDRGAISSWYNASAGGTYDEGRVSTVQRPADYIAAVYKNIAANGSFLSIESAPAAATSIAVESQLRTETGDGVRYVADGDPRIYADGVLVAEAPTGAKHVVNVTPIRKQYKVTLAEGEGGTVSPSGEMWVAPGTNFTVAATATNVTRAFYAWTGDYPTLGRFSRVIDFPVTKSCTLTANFGTAYYVSTTGDDGKDGLSSANAKATISNAVAVAAAGGVVLVEPGDYTSSASRIATISKAIAVRAKDGPGTVRFHLGQAGGGFAVSVDGAVVDGFTLYHAYYNTDGYVFKAAPGHFIDCAAIASTNTANLQFPVIITGGWLYRCLLTGIYMTSSSGSGGQRVLLKATGSDTIVDSCVISNNFDNSIYGGSSAMVYLEGATRFRNSLVVNNRHRVGNYCGVYAIGGEGTPISPALIENCTIADNAAGQTTAAGAGLWAATKTLVVNSIIDGNTVPAAGNGMNVQWGCTATFLNTLCGELTEVNGCLVEPPGFTARASGGYALDGLSAAVDAGRSTVRSATPGATDLAGNARVYGDAADLGAFEYAPDGPVPLDCAMRVDTASGPVPLAATFTAVLAGDTDGIEYLWNFGDGSTSAEANPTHTYTKAGKFTVSLTVTTYDGVVVKETASYANTDYMKVYPTTVYVRPVGLSTPTYPYDTPGTAANTLSTITDTPYAEGLVIDVDGAVSIGAYSPDFRTPVTIKGHGPDASTLNSTSTSPKMNTARTYPAERFVFQDLKVSGYNDTQFGLYGLDICGIVTNCVFTNMGNPNGALSASVRLRAGSRMYGSIVRDGRAKWTSNSTAGLAIYGGDVIVDRCVISNIAHSAGNTAFGALAVMGNYTPAPIVRNCLVTGCRVSTASDSSSPTNPKTQAFDLKGAAVVENCTIVGNESKSPCAGVYVEESGCTIRNCIAWGNWSKGAVTNNVLVADGQTCTFARNCSPDLASVEGGNFSADPQFNYGAKPKLAWYSLQSNSRCCNAGVNTEWMEGSVDLAGNPRRCGRVDLGCYENQTSTGLAIFIR